jgi:mono/diheme cytochrome c family protein
VGAYGHAGNPQHTANGLRYGIDNWLHSSDIPKKHRFVNGKLIGENTIHRGQFGVTFDDLGRFMTCYESSAIHADLIPADYLLRNPNYLKTYHRGGRDRTLSGINVNIARAAQEVYPIRVTPAITLGALELRDDGRLRTYTIVAGSCFYNGDQFPPDAYGNVFVPEAGGHLIGRLKVSGDLEPKATRFYPPEQEFLASTDERFRPVNSRVGPDGALYIADMYHGIIEHVIFLVPYLNNQIKERRLEEGNDMGRIYRIVSEQKPVNRARPQLSKLSPAKLVEHLGLSNGWWRYTAQRLLVENDDRSLAPALRACATNHVSPLGRLHALWTLEGLQSLDGATAKASLRDAHPYVRATGARLTGGDEVLELKEEPSELVRLHMLLALGSAKHTDAMLSLVDRNEHYLFRSAALTGLQNRELEFLSQLLELPNWKTPNEHRMQMIGLLAQVVFDEGNSNRIAQLLDRLTEELKWPANAIFDGIVAAVPGDLRNRKPFRLPREPGVLTALARSSDVATRERAVRVRSYFTWPGVEATAAAGKEAEPLTAEHQALFELGQSNYASACAPCHQPHGLGLPNVAPSLAGSEWVNGPPERLARVILHGLYGPIEVNGEKWNLHMPGFGGAFDDDVLAALLTYVRRSWDNNASPVEPSVISEVRQQTSSRVLAWTPEELGMAAASRNEAAVVRPGDKGELVLPARLAATYGRELAYRPSLDILGPWRRKEDVAEWRVVNSNAMAFEVFVTLAADDASAGDKFIVETEGSQTAGEVRSSGWYDRFHEYSCGKLTLGAGTNRVVLRPEGSLKRELADIRALRLVPVP